MKLRLISSLLLLLILASAGMAGAFTDVEVSVRELKWYDRFFGKTFEIVSEPSYMKAGERGTVVMDVYVPPIEKADFNEWSLRIHGSTSFSKGNLFLPCYDCNARLTASFIAPTRAELEEKKAQGYLREYDGIPDALPVAFEFYITDKAGRNTLTEYSYFNVWTKEPEFKCTPGETICLDTRHRLACNSLGTDWSPAEKCPIELKCTQQGTEAVCVDDPFYVPPTTTSTSSTTSSTSTTSTTSTTLQPGVTTTTTLPGQGEEKGLIGSLFAWIGSLFRNVTFI